MVQNAQEKKEHSPRKSRLVVLLLPLILFSLLTKLPRLGVPEKFYFDEVYHAFTATQYLHDNRQAYDPWAKPPEGVAFEWTHPPLAKLLMTGFMVVTGEHAWGWRIGSVIFGTASIVLTVLIALQLFGSIAIAGVAGLLLSIEGLFIAQSRIAMNDSYFVFFALLSVFFYIRWRREGNRSEHHSGHHADRYLLGAGIGLGLAVATKWTALYLWGLLGVDILVGWFWTRKIRMTPKLFVQLGVILLALPAAIYLASYAHYFSQQYTWEDFKVLQGQMWGYHTNLKATHSYQSKPWQWILNLKPVWFWVDYKDHSIANIYNLGNSIILWVGLVAVAWWVFVERVRAWPGAFLLGAYFVFWLPWMFSPRIMLFYHYTPAIPFLCIALARAIVGLRESSVKWKRALSWGVLASALIWFAVFFPHNTGIHVPKGFADAVYFALPGWR